MGILTERGTPPEELAVIYRARALAHPLEDILVSAGTKTPLDDYHDQILNNHYTHVE